MEPIEGEFQAHDEVDELRWVTPSEADELLTYPHDKELIHKALRRYRWKRIMRVLTPWSRQPTPGM
jgi:8-oxo-dGTP diphosphatase